MVTLKILDKPDLGHTKMTCDGVIHDKLTKWPMTNDAFSTSSFNIIIGRMGQGKTSLLTSFVKKLFNRCFEHIYVFMPSNSRASIENDIFGKNLPSNQLFDTLTFENLGKLYKDLQANSSDKFNSLVIIDDFQVSLKDPAIIQVLQRIVTKMRHLRCTIFLLQQNFQALVKPLRELASNLIIFNLGKSQLEKIFDEVMQMDKDTFRDLVEISFKDPHDWVLINLHRSRKIYRMFDEILLNP